jgi:hypothetical protein
VLAVDAAFWFGEGGVKMRLCCMWRFLVGHCRNGYETTECGFDRLWCCVVLWSSVQDKKNRLYVVSTLSTTQVDLKGD